MRSNKWAVLHVEKYLRRISSPLGQSGVLLLSDFRVLRNLWNRCLHYSFRRPDPLDRSNAIVQLKNSLRAATFFCALVLSGCAAEPGRVPGPGALVAGVGGKLVKAHDAVARSILGDAARPMLIGTPPATAPAVEESPARAIPAAATSAHRQTASAEMANIDFASATSVDLDGDGVISLEEILALGRSGLNDAEALERLERTGRTFDLSTSQEQYLRERGVSDEMIARLRTLNRPAAMERRDMAAAPVDKARPAP